MVGQLFREDTERPQKRVLSHPQTEMDTPTPACMQTIAASLPLPASFVPPVLTAGFEDISFPSVQDKRNRADHFNSHAPSHMKNTAKMPQWGVKPDNVSRMIKSLINSTMLTEKMETTFTVKAKSPWLK